VKVVKTVVTIILSNWL